MEFTLRQLIKQHEFDKNWNGQVFICYSNDEILRKRATGEHIADGELFKAQDLDDYYLDKEVKPNQYWIEDGDLCIDFYRTW